MSNGKTNHCPDFGRYSKANASENHIEVNSKNSIAKRISSEWSFTPSDDEALTSSGRKHIYHGTFTSSKGETAAYELIFEPGSIEEFGIECNMLGRLAEVGAGPELLAITTRAKVLEDGTTHPIIVDKYDDLRIQIDIQQKKLHPVIIERDAGTSLNKLIRGRNGSNASIPRLRPKDDPACKAEETKILFDIYSQVMNAHKSDIYHRDLTWDNVCVILSDEPSETKATLIDFEIGSTKDGGRPKAAKTLYSILFKQIPDDIISGKQISAETVRESEITPTPMELDLGYLAALTFILRKDRRSLMDDDPAAKRDFVKFCRDEVPFFRYDEFGNISTRKLDMQSDIEPLAQKLGLTPLTKENMISNDVFNLGEITSTSLSRVVEDTANDLLTLAQSMFHREYLTKSELKQLSETPYMLLFRAVDATVVKNFEEYKKDVGMNKSIRFEDQDPDLQYSGYDSARHMMRKVEEMGFDVKPIGSCTKGARKEYFTKDEEEIIAKAEHNRWNQERIRSGWVFKKAPKNTDSYPKTSPYIRPFEELSDGYFIYKYEGKDSVLDDLPDDVMTVEDGERIHFVDASGNPVYIEKADIIRHDRRKANQLIEALESVGLCLVRRRSQNIIQD